MQEGEQETIVMEVNGGWIPTKTVTGAPGQARLFSIPFLSNHPAVCSKGRGERSEGIPDVELQTDYHGQALCFRCGEALDGLPIDYTFARVKDKWKPIHRGCAHKREKVFGWPIRRGDNIPVPGYGEKRNAVERRHAELRNPFRGTRARPSRKAARKLAVPSDVEPVSFAPAIVRHDSILSAMLAERADSYGEHLKHFAQYAQAHGGEVSFETVRDYFKDPPP